MKIPLHLILIYFLCRIHPRPTMSDEVFCGELDKKSLIRLAVRYSFAKLLTMKLLTCKIECEKVKKIIDNITCPYMDLWR